MRKTIIEITSSPEPEHYEPPTKKRGGNEGARPRPVRILGPVIELTDTEGSPPPTASAETSQLTSRKNAVASGSRETTKINHNGKRVRVEVTSASNDEQDLFGDKISVAPSSHPNDDDSVKRQVLAVIPDISYAYLAHVMKSIQSADVDPTDMVTRTLGALFDGGGWPCEGVPFLGLATKVHERENDRKGRPREDEADRVAQISPKRRRLEHEMGREITPKHRKGKERESGRKKSKRRAVSIIVVDDDDDLPADTMVVAEEPLYLDKGKGKGKGKAEPVGNDIECQCCFGDVPFDTIIQCPEAHLFCTPCVDAYASTQLGQHRPMLLCMHSSGCAQPFPAAELARALPPKSYALWERLTQAAEIEKAGLAGLSECPFCEWKCVLEDEFEEGASQKFWCGNHDICGAVSCRLCKKKDHSPKTCEDAEADKHLDGRHAIEEAMTAALMRNCPKCKKGFIKEDGCNKMTCPTCRTFSCYVCRSVVAGYEHFDQTPRGQASTSYLDEGKCRLWDDVESRHAADVRAAAEEATEAYRLAHPDVEAKEIAVDVPTVPIPRETPQRGARRGIVHRHRAAGLPALPPAYHNARVLHPVGGDVGALPVHHAVQPQQIQPPLHNPPPAPAPPLPRPTGSRRTKQTARIQCGGWPRASARGPQLDVEPAKAVGDLEQPLPGPTRSRRTKQTQRMQTGVRPAIRPQAGPATGRQAKDAGGIGLMGEGAQLGHHLHKLAGPENPLPVPLLAPPLRSQNNRAMAQLMPHLGPAPTGAAGEAGAGAALHAPMAPLHGDIYTWRWGVDQALE